jgi:hypothetical protein
MDRARRSLVAVFVVGAATFGMLGAGISTAHAHTCPNASFNACGYKFWGYDTRIFNVYPSAGDHQNVLDDNLSSADNDNVNVRMCMWNNDGDDYLVKILRAGQEDSQFDSTENNKTDYIDYKNDEHGCL